jgi:hypothetical protein
MDKIQLSNLSEKIDIYYVCYPFTQTIFLYDFSTMITPKPPCWTPRYIVPILFCCYAIFVFTILCIYGETLMQSERYEGKGNDNGQNEIAIGVMEIVGIIFYLRMHLVKIRRNKIFTMDWFALNYFERFCFVIILFCGVGSIMWSFMAFANNCKYESVNPCHHLVTLAYIFVLIPVYITFLVVGSAVLFFLTWFCCEFCDPEFLADSPNST